MKRGCVALELNNLRYIEQRFARNEQWIENDWKSRGLYEK